METKNNFIPDKEKHLLSIFINSESARNLAITRVKKEDFSNIKNQIIFEKLQELNQAKKNKFDLILFLNYLKIKEVFKTIGGDYIKEINDLYISDELLEEYYIAIRSDSIKRQLFIKIKEIENQARRESDGDNLIKILHEKTQELNDFFNRKEYNLINISETISDDLLDSDDFLKGKTGYMTSFMGFDSRTSGLKGGELVILAARPSMGKTALALDLTFKLKKETGHVTGDIIFFSLEMSPQQMAQRIIFSHLNKTFPQRVSKNDLHNLKKNIEPKGIFINQMQGLTIIDIHNQMREWSKKRKIGMIVVDYLQLLKTVHKKNFESRNLEVAGWTRELKEMALEFNIPILCLSQLSRNVERREDKRPILSDLRDSGSIEQDADIVLFLYQQSFEIGLDRPKKTDDNSPTKLLEVIIAKNRNGPTGSFNLIFNKKKTTFTEYFGDTGPEPYEN